MEVGGERKREDSRFQLKDFQIKLPWQSRTNKNWHFFKAITNGCKKRQDKTMAKPLCASGAKSCWIPAQSWKNNWKTCYTSSLQFLGHFVRAQGHLCSHLLQEKPLLLAQGAGTATLLFSSFSHTSIRTLVIDKKHVVRMAPSTSLLPRRLKYQKDPNSAQLLWLFGSKI